jgi:hypothetical protein
MADTMHHQNLGRAVCVAGMFVEALLQSAKFRPLHLALARVFDFSVKNGFSNAARNARAAGHQNKAAQRGGGHKMFYHSEIPAF